MKQFKINNVHFIVENFGDVYAVKTINPFTNMFTVVAKVGSMKNAKKYAGMWLAAGGWGL